MQTGTSRPLDEKLTWKHPKSLIFLFAHLAVHFKADSAVQRKQKSDHPKYFYYLCRAEIETFTYKKHEKTFARISILSAPINRTTQRVKQIYLQIKKLIFLEIGYLGCGCFQGGFSSGGLDLLVSCYSSVVD
mgnify:CR=1 FL=1